MHHINDARVRVAKQIYFQGKFMIAEIYREYLPAGK